MQPTIAAPLPQGTRQRRHVTFLFADLVGSSALSERLDAEIFHDLIDQWLQAMTEEVERFGGTLNQFSGDGILVLFGAPLAHEDAPLQACRAALALQHRLAGMETAVRLVMRIGIDSGEIVAGLVGSDRRHEYAALGQRTNRAKRIQEHADAGSILISQDTYDLVREYFRLVPAGEFLAKGLSHAVVTYRLIGEQGQDQMPRLAATMSRWHSPFVGRDAAMERLQQGQRAAAQGHTQRIAIVGDAGVGKSRLLYECMQQARGSEFLVCEGRSTALRAHVPYAPYADILRSLCGITPDDDSATSASKLQSRFPVECCDLLNVIAAAIPQAAPAVVDSTARMLATLSALTRALHDQATRHPLLLILDDFHLSDPLSQQLTADLSEHAGDAAILICTAARRAGGETVEDETSTIQLEPLDPQSISALAATMDGLTADDCRRLAGWLDRQSGGLPLLIEELLVALQTTGGLRRDGGHWRLAADFQQEHLPGSVQDLIAARLDRIDASALAILQVAAVIGDDIRPAQIAMLGTDAGGLGPVLASFVHEGFLTHDTAQSTWRFRSDMARRVIYRSIPRQRREALHLRLAKGLEHSTLPQVEDPVLANHFHQGGDTTRAIALLRRAATRAEWAFANTDADALLGQVLNIAGTSLDAGDHAEVLLQRGRVRTAFLGQAAGLTDIDEAIELATRVGNATLQARALLSKGVALYRQFRFAESLPWLQDAECRAIAAAAQDLQIEALLQRAFVLSEIRISATTIASPTTPETGSVITARLCCEQALSLSRAAHNLPLEIQSLHSLGTAYLQELEYDKASEMFAHCIEQARLGGDRATEALALQSLARLQQFRFDFDAAAATIQQLQVLLHQLGDRRRLAFSAFNLAAAHLGSGDYEQARHCAQDALAEATRLGLTYLEKLTLRFLLGLYSAPELRARRVEASERLCHLLSEEAEAAELSDALISLADCYAESERPENSVAPLRRAAKIDIDLGNFERAQTSLLRLQEIFRRQPTADS